MYVIRANKSRQPLQYLARGTGRRPYRWAAGDDGLHAALRFSNEEEAGIIATGRKYYDAPARVIWDPLSTGKEPQRRRRGFIIKAGDYYVLMSDGVYRWQRGEAAAAAAYRFSSEQVAGRLVLAGFNGVAAVTARIIQV